MENLRLKLLGISIAFVACSAVFLHPTCAQESAPGRAVLSKSTGDALVIWDASKVVASIVRSKMADAAADGLLKRDAVRVLAKMLRNIDRTAKTITVRIIYAKSGDVSPVYGTLTFKGVEHYALLTVHGADAQSHKTKWKELEDKATIPSWFSYKVIGRLPARIKSESPSPRHRV